MERRVRALTPEDIVNYPLKQAVRGYAVRQVDDLLDRVADEFERVHRELAETRQRLAQAESRAEALSEAESTLKRTLLTAQRAAEQTVAEARERAATVVEQAQEEAERKHRAAVSRAREELDELRRGQRELSTHVEALRTFDRDYRETMRSFVENHLRSLDELEQRVPPSLPDAERPAADSQRAEEDTADSAAGNLEEPSAGPEVAGEEKDAPAAETQETGEPQRQATRARRSLPAGSPSAGEESHEPRGVGAERHRRWPSVDLSRGEHLRWQVESGLGQVRGGSGDHEEKVDEDRRSTGRLTSDRDDRGTVVIIHQEPRRRGAAVEGARSGEGA